MDGEELETPIFSFTAIVQRREQEAAMVSESRNSIMAVSHDEILANQVTPEKWSMGEKRKTTPMNCSPSKQCKRRRERLSEKIATFVFMDLETTGIFEEGSSRMHVNAETTKTTEQFTNFLNHSIINTRQSDYPRITEMSFVSVQRPTLVELREAMEALSEKEPEACLKMKVPCNVHTRQINPKLTAAEWSVYEAKRTGAKKGILVHAQRTLQLKNTFEQEWPSVVQFLDMCPKPVCMVAHNGIYFDFRILYGEIKRANYLERYKIPDDVLFIDSWVMIKQLEERYYNDLQTIIRGIKWNDVFRNHNAKVTAQQAEKSTGDEDSLEEAVASIRAQKNSTDHPLMHMNVDDWSLARKRRTKPEYFRVILEDKWDFNKDAALKAAKSVSAVYKDVIKGPYDAHYAQDDSEALLQICLAYGVDFLNYADNRAADFPF
ncbi:unnamed protein product [Caenorhabditis auriculariae]|uniref:Exonuclease domain-containing protein n=1 Tax=Caenorhabditis auriculariae TaxID=2777116 RepID=A0A8S1GVI3_9PELO|nr:unnamed protein product [Caenorhabditis auriculariae]